MKLIRSYQDTILDGEIVETTVLTPVGDPSNIGAAEKLLEALSDPPENVCLTIDLSRLRWLSAALVAALIRGVTDLSRRHIGVSIVGLTDHHARVLAATGLSEMIVGAAVPGCGSWSDPLSMPA